MENVEAYSWWAFVICWYWCWVKGGSPRGNIVDVKGNSDSVRPRSAWLAEAEIEVMQIFPGALFLLPQKLTQTKFFDEPWQINPTKNRTWWIICAPSLHSVFLDQWFWGRFKAVMIKMPLAAIYRPELIMDLKVLYSFRLVAPTSFSA